jgi:hypothetical protein
MTTITIADLNSNRTLDRKAMSFKKGGSAPWVYGWIVPYSPQTTPAFGQVVNFYQVNNSFYANQMINQYQTIDVNNSGANSNISLVPVMVTTPQVS